MPDTSGPSQGGQERLLSHVSAHLEVLREARAELDTDPAEARDAIHRVSSFIAEQAEAVGLTSVAEAARKVVAAGVRDPALLGALERALERLSSGGQDARILIVEDDPSTALLTRTAVEPLAAVMEFADTAAEARAILDDHRVDLIILDLVLPDADGRHLLMELSRDTNPAGTAVIVLTAKGSPATRAECFAYGASAFLEKPLDVNVLRATASDLLAAGRGRRGDVDPLATLPDQTEVREAFLRMQADRKGEPMTLALVEADVEGGGWDEEGRMSPGVREHCGRLASALRDGLGARDVVGRWGVSELVILLLGREPEACVRLLERVGGGLAAGPRPFLAGVARVSEDALFEDAVSWADSLLSETRMSPDASILHTTLATTRAPFALIVEDDPITASLLLHRLERSGFEVEHYDNGLRGLEAIRRTLPDLLVLDIRLPGMDGFEILARMKAEGLTANVRTMVLTGLGRESDVSRAFGLGAEDYLVKPFSPIELTARALRLVRR